MSYIFPFDEFKQIWNSEPLVILDTNGFLTIYRYSTETTEQILSVFESIPKNQFWIPYQVLEEYRENRQDVISREYTKYREVTKEVERIMTVAKNDISKQLIRFTKFKYPLVKELGEKINEAMASIYAQSQKYKEDIAEEVKKNDRMLKEDKVQLFVEDLVKSGHVGAPFNISTLLAIYTEGEQRYKYKIPPGYKDKDKKDDTGRKKFGDLVLWKQVLEKARSCQKPIIFITNDEKEDWWVLDKDQVPIRPRDELFLEFEEYSEHPLAIMTLTNFYNHVSKINEMVDPITYIEMNASDVCAELIEHAGWETTLNDELELTQYLIHSGELQEYVDNALADIEITELSTPELEIDSVDIDENQVIIEGSFQTSVEATITESFSKHYSEDVEASILIGGSISFEFEIDSEQEEDFIIMDTLKIVTGGFEILDCHLHYEDDEEYEPDGCVHCSNPSISYFTDSGESVCDRCSNRYDCCPGCGYLFDKGTLPGAFCEECQKNH